MLQHLTVNNYALINNIDVNFDSGLIIITGETGAGKSILLGALGLLLGQRADNQIHWNKEKKCFIEGQFNIEHLGLKTFFDNNELDYDIQLIIRREIAAGGKSRAFINDTPVSLQTLKDLGSRLIDIHSQHETLNLQNSGFQTSIIDSFAGCMHIQKEYNQLFSEYKTATSNLKTLVEASAKAQSEIDYLSFLIRELDELQITPHEDQKLEQELEILNHSNEIASGIQKAIQISEGEGHNIIHLIREQKNTLIALEKFNPDFSSYVERLKSCEIEIKDIAAELEQMTHRLTHNPQRILEIHGRLDKIYPLFQKHRVNTTEELFAKFDELHQKLESLQLLDDKVNSTKEQISQLETQLHILATEMSEKRKSAAPIIENSVQSILKELSMPDSTFHTSIDSSEQLNIFGYDKINFLFSANKGHQAGEISKIASGGELSRLMLALKSLITEQSMLPTIIFDEIDTGVSGNVAGKVAEVLKKLSSNKQVIVITHLPQIAAVGKTHLYVYKDKQKDITHTMIRELNTEERLIEIGKMLSSDTITDAAILQAKELMKPS